MLFWKWKTPNTEYLHSCLITCCKTRYPAQVLWNNWKWLHHLSYFKKWNRMHTKNVFFLFCFIIYILLHLMCWIWILFVFFPKLKHIEKSGESFHRKHDNSISFCAFKGEYLCVELRAVLILLSLILSYCNSIGGKQSPETQGLHAGCQQKPTKSF